jgi:hypothetical protein
MRKLLITIALLCVSLPMFATTPLGYVSVYSENLQDSTGTKVASATISFTPTNNSGIPISYKVNGNGQASERPVTALVTNGAFTILLADTALTSPQNVCFNVTAIDNVTNRQLLGPGYSCIQPAGSGVAVTGTNAWCSAATGSAGGTCFFDILTPNLAALAVIQQFPTGPIGPQGPTGATGATGAQGPSYPNTVSTGLGAITATLEWSYQLPANGQTYSTPILTTDQGVSAIAFQGYDWYFYVLNSTTGSLLWRKAFNGPNYGRAQAQILSGTTTTFFGASHGEDATGPVATQGANGGAIWSMNYLGANNWQMLNSFGREGTGTATSGTTTSLTDTTKTWAVGEFMSPRLEGVGTGAILNITGGTGSGETCEVASVLAHKLTCVAAMTTAPASGSTYAVTPRYTSDEYFQHAGTLNLESGTWYLYSTGFDGEATKINASTGAVVWKYEVNENMEAPPLIAGVSGGSVADVLIESVNGYVYDLNSSTGALIWSVLPEQVSSTVALDGYIRAADVENNGGMQVILGCRSSHVFILNGTNGATIAETSGNYGDTYAGVDNGAAIYNANGSGYLDFAYADHAGFIYDNDQTGATIWRAFVGVTINSSIIYGDVFNTGGTELAVLDMAGAVTIMNPLTGAVYGSFNVRGGGEGTMLLASVLGDGQNELVITTLDGYVLCYKVAFV